MSATLDVTEHRLQSSALQGVLITLGLALAAFVDCSTATATGLVQPWVQGDYGGLYLGVYSDHGYCSDLGGLAFCLGPSQFSASVHSYAQ